MKHLPMMLLKCWIFNPLKALLDTSYKISIKKGQIKPKIGLFDRRRQSVNDAKSLVQLKRSVLSNITH